MGSQTESKLNRLLKEWPKGTVATHPWLLQLGVSRQLARRYVASGWMERLGRGAFVRSGEAVDWPGALHALQSQLNLSVHAAGLTALSLKGMAHYLQLGAQEEVFLLGERRERLPAWFLNQSWDVRLRYHCPNLFAKAVAASFTRLERGEFAVRISAPERAILEVLHLATTNEAIEHAVLLMGGLSTLRPRVVQDLLEACRSIKVKRLFLWGAEHTGHAWSKRLSTGNVNLGVGKRVLYRGGRLDRTHQITVPPLDASGDV
jgi:hypothetical protein